MNYYDKFVSRHIGPNEDELKQMLEVVKSKSLDDLMNDTIPSKIKLENPLKLDVPASEYEFL